MSKPATAAELLTVCVQDLHAGAVLLAQRLPAIAEAAATPALRDHLIGIAERSGEGARRYRATGEPIDGADNLWMDGILVDAERDTRDERYGSLRDVALIGAVRKALAARIVSDETAIALADRTGSRAVRDVAEREREQARADDARLRVLLDELAAGAVGSSDD